ncbi:hypothetical protein [Variovorax fucosicus]|uniref:hypothetical protein n=1 Tax=Variovorax fucosicus TaxID=3053517 RepID=UPI002575AB6F|nr:hypothetical protein [Variovorax sp. J22G47]MDM0057350.1 hypothetical protein [Variovorax sp. J22G47]
MDYYGDLDALIGLNPSAGNESLLRQQARLRDREADLKEKAKAARSTAAPQGQMVGNGQFQHYVAPHWTQQLAPLAQQIAGEYQKRGLEADQTGYDVIEAKAAKAHLDKQPPDDAPQTTKIAWAQQGAQIPALRSLMTDYAKDQMITAPERQAQREARKDLATQTQAEKAAAQARELEYRRERDADRLDDKEKDRSLRATLHAAVKAAGGGGGGDKASNYQIVQDAEGNASRVNKLTGEVIPLGGIGRETASLTADRTKQGENKANAGKALEDLNEAEKLLKSATGSKAGSLRDTIAAAAGYSTDGAKSAAALEAVANNIVANIPRMAGQVSDADLAFLKKQGGDLANKELPTETRLAALKQVRRVMGRAANAQPASPVAPSIRDAVKAASQPSSDDELLNKYLRK